MNVKLRLDQNGQPYLVITHTDVDQNESDVEQDALRNFFTQLSQNGASLHVMGNSKKGETKLLVVSNSEKRGYFRLNGDNQRSQSINHGQIVAQPVTQDPVAQANERLENLGLDLGADNAEANQ